MNKMYEYLLNHNYISQNKQKSPLIQQELSEERAECIANKFENLINEDKENLIKYLEDFISKTDNEINIKGNYLYLAWSNAYKDLLERLKSGNYE